MNRDIRLQLSGFLFYITTSLLLISTEQGSKLLANADLSTREALTALLTIGALLITSEAMGFIFSSIYVFYWNTIRAIWNKPHTGYSAEWKKFESKFNIKDYVIKEYDRLSENRKVPKHTNKSPFRRALEKYPLDVIQSYFLHQAPQGVVDWIIRRYTAFFTGASASVAFILGLAASWLAILILRATWTTETIIITAACLLIVTVLKINGHYPRLEARQMVEFWLADKEDQVMAQVVRQILSTRPIGHGESRPD